MWTPDRSGFTSLPPTDTVVDVLPRNPKKDADVRAAEQTRVTYTGGALNIAAPKMRYPLGRTGTVDICRTARRLHGPR